LVGCEDFLLLVPRSKEKAFDELGVNGVGNSLFYAGFMGSVLFKSKEVWQKFIKE
jgi:ATP adenylyltransferase/5',5'''-P-1,P-4-tetraphosphate phosphorylase II